MDSSVDCVGSSSSKTRNPLPPPSSAHFFLQRILNFKVPSNVESSIEGHKNGRSKGRIICQVFVLLHPVAEYHVNSKLISRIPAFIREDTFDILKQAKASIGAPSTTSTLPEDYVERVKRVHESGGCGSRGYNYDWKREEANKNLLRTHTTAVSSRMLYALA